MSGDYEPEGVAGGVAVSEDAWEATPAEREKALLALLHRAATIASELGRSDILRGLGRLIRLAGGYSGAAVGRGGRTMTGPLRPVGPVIELDEWISQVAAALQELGVAYRQAHEEDPANFQMQRTSADWFEELQARMDD